MSQAWNDHRFEPPPPPWGDNGPPAQQPPPPPGYSPPPTPDGSQQQWTYPYDGTPNGTTPFVQPHELAQVNAPMSAATFYGAGTIAQPQPQPLIEQHPVDMPQTLLPEPATLVDAEPQYVAPIAPRRDPQRTALAAVLAFIAMIIALWAILGYLHSMAQTLSSVSSGNAKLELQLTSANEGLAALQRKTGNVTPMAADAKQLRTQLEGIDKAMGTMLGSVGTIGSGMSTMNTSLATLNDELATVNDINGSMTSQLVEINSGLKQQKTKVGAMRKDVQGTSTILTHIPAKLNATNSRLTHVNGAVCYMGQAGIANNMKVHITFLGINNGSADVNATMVPKGAWGC